MKLPSINTLFVPVLGTLDLSTPPIAKKAGSAINALNVQPIWGGGFGRIEGYEPIDGKTKPSDYTFYTIDLKTTVSDLIMGKKVTVNGFEGHVIRIDNRRVFVESSAMIANDGDALLVEEFNATYIVSRCLKEYGIGSAEEFTALKALAHKSAMARVTEPLGVNQITGAAKLGDNYIVFRDSDDGSESLVSVGTQSGWSKKPDTFIVNVREVVDPALLVRGVSVEVGSRTLKILESDFAADGKTGWIAFDIGGVNKDEAITLSGSSACIADTDSQIVKVSAGGVWHFVYHNFYSDPATFYAYGCNGSQVIELRPDGAVIPLQTAGLSFPSHIEVHRNHLFVAFKGGSYGHSRVGYPMSWSGLLGAEQFSTGDEITGMKSVQGGALIISGTRSIYALFGEIRENWVVKALTTKVGIKANTLTGTFIPIAQSSNGLIRIDATNAFGDFIASELQSNKQAPNLAMRDYFATATIPDSNQVRFYGKSGGLIVELQPDGKTRTTEFNYPNAIYGVWQTPDSLLLAFSDGKLYRQCDEVQSFAGLPIQWAMRLAYSHCGSPTVVKSWKSAEIQMDVANALNIKVISDFDYGSPDKKQSRRNSGVAYGGGGRWNESEWNNFYWSAPDYATPVVPLTGNSRNISILIAGESDHQENFDISGFILNFIPRREYRV
ncbi:hypothetical protein ACPD0E_001864 [Vibrio cholerae]